MLVRKLIDTLSKMDQNAQVRIGSYDGENALLCNESAFSAYKGLVVIESASNIDILAEIDARFDKFKKDRLKELYKDDDNLSIMKYMNIYDEKYVDFIIDLINTGFTETQIIRYINALYYAYKIDNSDTESAAATDARIIFDIYNKAQGYDKDRNK